jgi:DnaJ-class molecular chaperone
MTDTTLTDHATPAPQAADAAKADCQECVGSGGWFRYEPALESAPGLLYLSCVQCRGTGKTAEARG